MEQVPEGVDCLALSKNAMDKYSVEIAGGLGPSAGKVWRVGIMVSILHFLSETLAGERLQNRSAHGKMGRLTAQAAHISQLRQVCRCM